MNANKLKSYRFATEAQWNTCLFAEADRDARRTGGTIQPFAPYEPTPIRYESDGAFAPAITNTRDIIWRDQCGVLHRLSTCDEKPETQPAPLAIARAKRIVTTFRGLWVIGDPANSVELYDADSLTRLLVVDLPNTNVIDLASNGRGILALVERKGGWQAIPIDCAGHLGEPIIFEGIQQPEAFVFLRRSKRFVVLTSHCQLRLNWFAEAGGLPLFTRVIAAVRPCFEGRVLGTDGTDRVFLGGADGKQFKATPYVVTFDADGNQLGDLAIDPLDGPITGITAIRNSLLVTGSRGLLRFNVAEAVPESAEQVSFTLLTPVLFSPDREDKRRWLRVQAVATLPEGTTLEISYGSTDKQEIRDQLNKIATDNSMTASQRIQRLSLEPEFSPGPTIFYGTAGSRVAKTFSAKLFDVKDRFLWVRVSLTATAGARLPSLSELSVLYPGRTLMQDLPSIYQKEEARPQSFLRDLVGVLETTTQGLDSQIASMGRQIHPDTATEPWLNFIARWLGLPWDDALSLEQKRALVLRAADLAKNRGTRAGLEALLESLLPGTPRRFRITDRTADSGFAIVGGGSCAGSALPAMLGGRTRWTRELGSDAVLGHMRLPCPGQLNDGVWHLTGKIRVDMAATAAERKLWEPWLLALIEEMVPLTARVELRWVTAHSLRSNRLDGTITLQSAPAPHLGTDAITNLARLPERGAHLSASGPTTGTRLR
ncbi:MAG TPA: phage tail protein [Pyrinomonadaceae bacterium]|nr:phage tail protein [Pyrinomonadaceae bacterium]